MLIVMAPGPLLSTAFALLGGAGAIAFGILVAELARDARKRCEPELWRSWDGPPATRMLRHRAATDPTEIDRLHRDVSLATGVKLPTAEEEAAEPSSADRDYEEAVRILRKDARTRPF